MQNSKHLRSLLFGFASLTFCLGAPLGCDAPTEPDEVVDSDGEDEDQGDEDEFRFWNPWTGHTSMITSMNAYYYGGNDGGCWDTSPSGSSRPFQQYRCHAKDNQLWRFEAAGGGEFTIHSEDDSGLCVDVPGFNTSPGQGLQLYPCNGGINQVWTVVNHDAQSSTIRPSANQNLCIEVANAVKTNQSPLRLGTCNGGSHQAWRFHDYAGQDTSLDCNWSMRFGPEVVYNGTRRSFQASGSHFNTLCSQNLQSDSVSCPGWADWFVVDSPWGSNDFDVRCFNTF